MRHVVRPGKAIGAQQATRRLSGAGRCAVPQGAGAREDERERKPGEGTLGNADGAHERERLAIGAEQEMLAVVQQRAAILDAARASAGDAIRLEERDGDVGAH
jgi:hypothetical protein